MSENGFTIILCLLGLMLMVSARRNATYDPLKGTYMDSFQDSSGRYNCSVYFAYRTMFFIDNCNSSSSFVRGLNFTFVGEYVPRVVYTPFGVLLEVQKVPWGQNLDNMFLNITSEDDPRELKSIDIYELLLNDYRYFDVPTLRGLSSLYGDHVRDSESNVLMNTKIILLFYLEFDNYFVCDAFFWVGKGDGPDLDGMKIPDETGSLEPLGNYYKKSITLRLPRMNISDPMSPEMTIYDIDYIGIFCPDTQQTYGRITTDEFNVEGHYPITIHPPFIFDRFFLGEEILLCLPNGTYSREFNLDDRKAVIPCLGRGSKISLETIAIPLLLTLLLLHHR